MEIKLDKTYNIDGEQIDTIELDFEKLTGRKLIQLEKDFKKENKGELILVANNAFAAKVAAFCAGMREDDILDMSGKDFTAITTEVTVFLNS
ncbi:phage tail assembly protein [Sebaldella termitidis]|uniref:phage tail assembly protein n=1 Tax=Sebaldella termitidis TaxID=826 RepID=UPI003EB9B611